MRACQETVFDKQLQGMAAQIVRAGRSEVSRRPTLLVPDNDIFSSSFRSSQVTRVTAAVD